MTKTEKGGSPFYPGQPVPVELFVGRSAQIDRIRQRGVRQVAAGKPATFFVQGEYGIGKSSIAGYVQRLAEREHGLLRVYANLGGAEDLTGLAGAVLEATLRSGAFNPNVTETIRNWLSKYIGKQELFGLSLNMDALRKDAPSLATPYQLLAFLGEAKERLKGAKIRGVFLVLDEINGLAANPQFAHFVKGVVEQNAMADQPLPLLLMLCGVEERRRQMIENHPPVDRIFEVIDIEAMSEEETADFFTRSFGSVHMSVEPDAMKTLTKYSAGLPKIMHLVGDVAYWLDQDGIVKKDEAFRSVVEAAEEVGKKYVEQQVYKALRSPDYHSILATVAKMGPDRMTFTRQEVAAKLTDTEKSKLDNFLQKMKHLNVIRSGDVKGEYVFNVRMVRFYIWLQSVVKKRRSRRKS